LKLSIINVSYENEILHEGYGKQLGVAPGVPTMKGAYGDPENTGVGYNAVLTELGNHDVPQGWIQTPHPNTTPGTNPGAPVSWNDPSNPDDPQAGYGYIPNDTTKEETFFYHSDHLGSTSYITDDKANITQYDAYLPYGELLVDEHSSSEELPYKFNGKQFDDETGLYYYGARYLNPMASVWYGVDPLAEKFPVYFGYSYCYGNPTVFIDYKGKYPTKKEAAKLANHIYDGKAGDIVDGWTLKYVYTSKYSDSFKAGLYTKKTNGKIEYVLANAGTYFENSSKGRQSVIEDLKQPFGYSVDMHLSLKVAKEVVRKFKNSEITFVGHSKGGAEAAANAVATNRNAILFNPAAVNLKKYGLSIENYTGYKGLGVTAMVVRGEFLDETINRYAEKIDKKIYLPSRDEDGNAFDKHTMKVVIKILNREGYK